jgi:hypothetical protein
LLSNSLAHSLASAYFLLKEKEKIRHTLFFRQKIITSLKFFHELSPHGENFFC